MKKIYLLIVTSILFLSCNEDDIEELFDSTITAKEPISEVITAARTTFAADARLSAIYGKGVDINGEIDLRNTVSLNAFVYIVQSSINQSNEFYVPVFGAGPVKSPINFITILSFISDTTAKNIVSAALGTLASVSIDDSVDYMDSPAVIDTAMQYGGSVFMDQHSDTKIDLLLLPSKSIDTTSISNSADWIVNFHSSSGSLVLWLNTQTGNVIKLSQ
ncbi:MAG: hypothetical protein IPM56_16645 [Ignavibacteriales bacterium]|nr:MAG: hypothetical protein IPM56_16645 [Ignavibacteriales bacterium]